MSRTSSTTNPEHYNPLNINENRENSERIPDVQIVLIVIVVITSILIIGVVAGIIYVVRKNYKDCRGENENFTIFEYLKGENKRKKTKGEDGIDGAKGWRIKRPKEVNKDNIPVGFVYEDRTENEVSTWFEKRRDSFDKGNKIVTESVKSKSASTKTSKTTKKSSKN